MRNAHLQFEALVKDRVERVLDDFRLLHSLSREEEVRTQLDQHERVAQPVRVQRNDVLGIQN